tara:strand:+ start:734 stop:1045 length:312 start_codon:yes stop_codon:yes gene_type:complete
MAKSNIVIKNIKLNINKDELDMIADAINSYVEEMETGNDDLSLRTIDVGKHNFYKVDKGVCEHTRKWYIKYYRLSTQLNRLNNKISCVDDLPWRSTKQLARAT